MVRVKILFSKVSNVCFLLVICWGTLKNQQRSSDLSLIDEKIRLSKGSSASNFRHAYIMDYPTKETLKNFEFSVQRLSLKSVIHIRNLKTKYLWKIYFVSINHSAAFFLLSLKVGLPSAMMFTIIKESHLLLIKCLNHHMELIFMEKIQSL